MDKELILQISDDGNGFDANQDMTASGLSSIQKRLRTVAGVWKFDSTQGSGTRIFWCVKLSRGHGVNLPA